MGSVFCKPENQRGAEKQDHGILKSPAGTGDACIMPLMPALAARTPPSCPVPIVDGCLETNHSNYFCHWWQLRQKDLRVNPFFDFIKDLLPEKNID